MRRNKTLTLSNGRSLKRVREALCAACSALYATHSYLGGNSLDTSATIYAICEDARNKCALALYEVNATSTRTCRKGRV